MTDPRPAFLAALALLLAPPALACKCALVAREQVIAATPVVFDGEVLRVELDASGKREVTTLRVHGVIKGLSAGTASSSLVISSMRSRIGERVLDRCLT